MITINQDKTLILNFENIEAIGIGNPLGNNDRKFKIFCNMTSGNQYIIAEYKTEERAKEVLQVIGERGGVANFIYSPKVYEVPKE